LKKVSISWSGGKDSALALDYILEENRYEVDSIHTTFDSTSRKVNMHGISEALIEKQAQMMEIPLVKIYIPKHSPNDKYRSIMYKFLKDLKHRGINGIVYGDIFLEDLKNFRINLVQPFGIEPIFPLWQMESLALIERMQQRKIRSKICSINTQFLEMDILGEDLDRSIVSNFSKNVDPCGERGEYHSFVYEAPFFEQSLKPIILGKQIKKYPMQIQGNLKCEYELGLLRMCISD